MSFDRMGPSQARPATAELVSPVRVEARNGAHYDETASGPSIGRGLDWLSGELDRLNVTVDELRKRIDPVVRRVDSPIQPPNPTGSPESASPFSDRVHESAARVADLNQRLIRLLDGLDL